MSFHPFLKLLRNNQLLAALGVNRLFKPFYKLTYLAAAKNSGVLDLLSNNPVPFDTLAATYYCKDTKAREALTAWLQLGIRLGFLSSTGQGYSLKGLARTLSLPQNDATLALAQEVVELHHKLILDTPTKLKNGELWTLADQDGELIARSSRALEAFQIEAIDRTFPASGAVRLLEIGCGSGFYIKYAAERNPSLTAIGLELQPDVAETARRNITEWNLAERVTIETGDIRAGKWGKWDQPRADGAGVGTRNVLESNLTPLSPFSPFDIATLYNNIYYFPVDRRVELLAHVKHGIKPGGFLLLTTCCQGGSVGLEVLNLWGAATEGAGRLPDVDEMASQLKDAGFDGIQSISLIPGDRFYAFRAWRRG
jgi:SAM-dependent methyltransferase